eukprot:365816-Chlamydomonas_euryale.AAC.3
MPSSVHASYSSPTLPSYLRLPWENRARYATVPTTAAAAAPAAGAAHPGRPSGGGVEGADGADGAEADSWYTSAARLAPPLVDAAPPAFTVASGMKSPLPEEPAAAAATARPGRAP